MNTKKPKIKPCPKCGGPAATYKTPTANYVIYCFNSYLAHGSVTAGTKPEAIKSWNCLKRDN